MRKTRGNTGGGGKKDNEKAKATKARDTATSPYYKAIKKGGIKASMAKNEMKSYFKNVHGNNTRGETEAQHLARMKKREQTNRKRMGLK